MAVPAIHKLFVKVVQAADVVRFEPITNELMCCTVLAVPPKIEELVKVPVKVWFDPT